ncbi:MAG: cytochrome C oxidase subunit III [Rubripirellula sp.]|nr:cytochrome C oxidase subunit III [Rubripirellula sp.]
MRAEGILKPKPRLPSDSRYQLGGMLFLVSLLIFFISSILLYVLYAWSRRDDPQTQASLPASFLISTACLMIISILVHIATRSIRRDRHLATFLLLSISGLSATLFMGIQYVAMIDMLSGPGLRGGTGRGVAGMVAVLALLHALHVAGGVIALGIVSVRSLRGRYDHERHWPVDFAAQYWHFLDLVWVSMLVAFWLTTGGFDLTGIL